MKNTLIVLFTLFVFEVAKANISVFNAYYFVEVNSLTNEDTISITLNKNKIDLSSYENGEYLIRTHSEKISQFKKS